MKILVSAERAGQAPDLQDITPWLSQKNPVWEGEPPLGVFLSDGDRKAYETSDFAGLMALLDVPLALDENLTDFRAAAMAARVSSLKDTAYKERAAAAALRKDYMELQQNFVAVEGFLHGAMAPKFTLARQWDFADQTLNLAAGEKLEQPLPVSSEALVAVDIWMNFGQVQVSLFGPDGGQFVAPINLNDTGWQRAQFPAIAGPTNDISICIEAVSNAELGVSNPSALPEYGDTPLALRLWKGLVGVRLPDVTVLAGPRRSFVMPAELPAPEATVTGSAKYLETANILMIHTDYYGAAKVIFRGAALTGKCSAHIQNCGPETLELTICQVQCGQTSSARYLPSVFLAPEAYMRCDVLSDGSDAVDLIVKIKGQTSLDCLSIRGFEIG